MSGALKRKIPSHIKFRNDDELEGDEYLKPIHSVSKVGSILKGDADDGDLAEKDIVDEDEQEYPKVKKAAKETNPTKPINIHKRKKLEKLREKMKRAKELEREADATKIANLHKLNGSSKGTALTNTNTLQYKIGYDRSAHAEFVNKKLSEFFRQKLSAIEMADAQLTASHFVETSAAPVSNLIKHLHPNWRTTLSAQEATLDSANDADGVRGLPVVVIITGSAMRAADVYRSLISFTSIGSVGKLFAKHIKVAEHVELLHSKVVKIIVGTPNRILKLAEMGELRFTRTKHLFIDGHLDQKAFSVFDVQDTKRDLLTLLQQFVIPCARTNGLLLGLTDN